MDPAPRAEVEREDVPRVKLADILLTANSLVEVLRWRLGKTIDDDILPTLTDNICEVLDCYRNANVYETLLQWKGRVVDMKLVNMLALQFAARAEELEKGFLLAFERPVKTEWIGMEVVDVAECVWDGKHGKQSGAELFMIALTGHPAGHPVRRKFPVSFLNGVAYKMGFTRRTPYDYDIRNFIRFQFWGYLVPKEGPELVFEDWAFPPRELKHNKAIISLRTRFETERATCPKDYDHLCWDCRESRSTCVASTVKAAPK